MNVDNGSFDESPIVHPSLRFVDLTDDKLLPQLENGEISDDEDLSPLEETLENDKAVSQ